MAQLNAINGIFKENKCGQELAGFLDYTNAFVDVVLGVSPFLALYGGLSAAPWVLGTALSGATVKVVTNYFKNRTVNMRNHEQSSLFIKNSCSFYYLNQMKSSIDDLHMQRLPRLHSDLNREKQLLSQHMSVKPTKPNDPIFEEQKENESDFKIIENLESRFNTNSLESCSFIRRYVKVSE